MKRLAHGTYAFFVLIRMCLRCNTISMKVECRDRLDQIGREPDAEQHRRSHDVARRGRSVAGDDEFRRDIRFTQSAEHGGEKNEKSDDAGVALNRLVARHGELAEGCGGGRSRADPAVV